MGLRKVATARLRNDERGGSTTAERRFAGHMGGALKSSCFDSEQFDAAGLNRHWCKRASVLWEQRGGGLFGTALSTSSMSARASNSGSAQIFEFAAELFGWSIQIRQGCRRLGVWHDLVRWFTDFGGTIWNHANGTSSCCTVRLLGGLGRWNDDAMTVFYGTTVRWFERSGILFAASRRDGDGVRDGRQLFTRQYCADRYRRRRYRRWLPQKGTKVQLN